MDIPAQFSVLHRVDSFSEYHTPRFYQSVGQPIKKQPKQFKKRQTYITEIEKRSKKIPGPGKYIANPEDNKKPQKKQQKKVERKKLKKSQSLLGKVTYVDDIIKLAKRIPAVGKYNLQVDHTQQIRNKFRKRGQEARKNAQLFRPTLADTINIDTMKISPGDYDTLKPLGYKSKFGSINPEPHPTRSESLPQIPSAFDYNPIPVSYGTFSKIQSVANLGGKKKAGEHSKRMPSYDSLGPGPKYSLIVDWIITKKNGKTKGNNYLKSIYTPPSKGIYH